MPKKWTIALIIAAVVLVAGASAFIYFSSTSKHKNETASDIKVSTPNNEIKNGVKTDAPAGQLAEGFPETFAPVGGTITSSYDVKYQSASQYTADFTSSKTLNAEYNSYISYLNTNKYSIVTKELNKDSAHIYAQNDTGIVNIVLNQPTSKDKLAITVSYVKNK